MHVRHKTLNFIIISFSINSIPKLSGGTIIYLFEIISDRNDSVFRHLIYYKYANNIRNDWNISDTSRTNGNSIPIGMRLRNLSLTIEV